MADDEEDNAPAPAPTPAPARRGVLKKVKKEDLWKNPRIKTRINLTGRYLPCPSSGYREAGSVHGLTFVPVKRGNAWFFIRCGICGTVVQLSAEWDPSKHGLTYDQAFEIADQAARDGMGGIII